MDLIWTLCRTSNLPFAIHFQLVTVGSILAHILTSKKCLIVHSAWQSWSQSISKHILFCKYCISQFIDIRSCFVLLVQRANELNSGNHRRAFQREWWKLTKVTHICQLISFFFFQVSGMLSFADSRETTDMSLKLILHFWQEANKKFINHTLVSISVLV